MFATVPYFDTLQLDCCKSLEDVQADGGITIDELARLAGCNAAAAEVFRASGPHGRAAQAVDGHPAVTAAGASGGSSTAYVCYHRMADAAVFRQTVAHACQRGAALEQDEVLLAAYSSSVLGCCEAACNTSAAGSTAVSDTRFAPIVGFHAAADAVLLLDTSRGEHPPFWVPVQRLWEAMGRPDARTRLPNGFVVLKRRAAAPLLLFHDSPLGPACQTTSAARTRAGEGGKDAASRRGHGHVCLNMRLQDVLASALEDAKRALLAAPLPGVGDGGGMELQTAGAGACVKASAQALPQLALLQHAVAIFVSALRSHKRAPQIAAIGTALLESAVAAVAPDASEHPAERHTAPGHSGAEYLRLGAPPPASEHAAGAGRHTAHAALIQAAAPFTGSAASASGRGKRPAGAEESRCVSKLSREHISSTTQLLRELEATPIFGAVTLALAGHLSDSPARGATPDGHSHVPSVTAALADAMRRAGPLDVGSLRPGAHCEGVTCMRIREAHLYTLLLMAWALPLPRRARCVFDGAAGSGPASAGAAGASVGHSGSTSESAASHPPSHEYHFCPCAVTPLPAGSGRVAPAPEGLPQSQLLRFALHDAVGSAVSLASPLLAQELALLHHELRQTAGVLDAVA